MSKRITKLDESGDLTISCTNRKMSGVNHSWQPGVTHLTRNHSSVRHNIAKPRAKMTKCQQSRLTMFDTMPNASESIYLCPASSRSEAKTPILLVSHGQTTVASSGLSCHLLLHGQSAVTGNPPAVYTRT